MRYREILGLLKSFGSIDNSFLQDSTTEINRMNVYALSLRKRVAEANEEARIARSRLLLFLQVIIFIMVMRTLIAHDSFFGLVYSRDSY
jgi:hypothetical protein